MKLKGISWFEQHAEKIVFAAIAVIALAVLALQFLTQPNMVKVGTAGTVPPAQAFVPVERAAEALRGRLDAADPTLPEAKPFALAGSLEGGFAPPELETTKTALGPAPTLGGLEAVQQVTSAQIAQVTIPAPVNPVAAPYRNTISPAERIRNKELAPLLPQAQPFDKAYVSIEATVNGPAIREALRADPDGSGPIESIPLSWLQRGTGPGSDLFEVITVEVERQTISLPDGRTPPEAAVTIRHLPGRTDFLKLWNEQVTVRGDVEPMLATIAEASPEILRPDFYPTIAGPEWIPPTEANKAAAGETVDPEVARLRRQLERVRVEIDRVTQAMGNTDQNRPDPRDPGRNPGGGGKGGGPGGRAPEQERQPQQDTSKLVLERRLETLRGEETRLTDRLTALGDNTAAAEPGAPGAAAFQYLLDNPSAKVWVHDVTAEPGARYRYRVRLVVNNPYFGRSLQESQQGLAQNSLMRGEWSAWSEPVEVTRDSYYFITSAEEQTALSPRPRATAELYSFYYGYYRQARVSLEPGDPVVAEADLPELKLADMARLEQMIQEEQPLDSMQGQQPGMLPGTPPGGKGLPGMAPGAPPPPPGSAETALPDWMSVDGPRKRVMGADAIFLDVSPAIGVSSDPLAASRQAFKVVLRDSDGALVVRQPDSDRTQQVYKMVEASAKAGETQGAPEIKPEVEQPRAPIPPRRDRQDDRQPPSRAPGGGGGGGGG